MHGMPLSYLDQMVAQGHRRHAGRTRRRAARAAGPAVPAGPQRHTEPGLRRRARASCPTGAVSTTRSRRAGAARATTTACRSARCRPSTTPARRSSKALQTRPGRPARPGGRLHRVHHRRGHGPGDRIEYQALRPTRTRPGCTTLEPAGPDVRAGRQRDREPAADARLRPAQLERADRAQPDGPRLPAELGAAAGGGRHLSAGTNCTGGITDLRGGRFRRRQAAFAVDIHNDGWGWATGAPYTDLIDLVDDENRFGEALRQRAGGPDLAASCCWRSWSRCPPSPSNRVTVDPSFTDELGNMRPGHLLHVPEYTMRGVAYARQLVAPDLPAAGRRGPHRATTPTDCGYVTLRGRGLRHPRRQPPGRHAHHGQRARRPPWSTPTSGRGTTRTSTWSAAAACRPSGTSNITLTIAALCLPQRRAMIWPSSTPDRPIDVAYDRR